MNTHKRAFPCFFFFFFFHSAKAWRPIHHLLKGNRVKSFRTYLRCYQKQALESRLEDQQKEYESLSEAHNSLEQLNSNWSEQNMEQKTKIESMVKEVHDLTMRLAQAEESIKSQEKTNEELKNTYSNEVLHFLIRRGGVALLTP